ncbi:hypothetical protein IG631_00911 [Alternaria alternata]|nr:hypothetical protein IG631_00911 [Alternaria alternata]
MQGRKKHTKIVRTSSPQPPLPFLRRKPRKEHIIPMSAIAASSVAELPIDQRLPQLCLVPREGSREPRFGGFRVAPAI